MHCVTNIHEDLYWLGGSDRQLAKFENVFPIPRGVSYNAYLVLDEKTVLLDTVDKAVGDTVFSGTVNPWGSGSSRTWSLPWPAGPWTMWW